MSVWDEFTRIFYDGDEYLLKRTDLLSEWLQTERGVPLPTILAVCIWGTYLCFSLMMLSWTIQMDREVFMVLGPITSLAWAPTAWSLWKRLDVYYKHAEKFDDENLRKMYSALALVNQQVHSTYRIFLYLMVAETGMISVFSVLFGGIPFNLPDVIFFASVTLLCYLECSFPRIPRVGRRLVPATVST